MAETMTPHDGVRHRWPAEIIGATVLQEELGDRGVAT
jgi:hypothetical protein